ncbi:Flap-structured DNA-binding and RNA-binding protein [Allomyces arbusculus]|nr:Flap-structured DNA-binding and RNA-binding protein [Allomyces arbusculus]
MAAGRVPLSMSDLSGDGTSSTDGPRPPSFHSDVLPSTGALGASRGRPMSDASAASGLMMSGNGMPALPQGYDAHAYHLEQTERLLHELRTTPVDPQFRDELVAMEDWFKVLSDAERTLALYTLFQYVTPVQGRFLRTVLDTVVRRAAGGNTYSPAPSERGDSRPTSIFAESDLSAQGSNLSADHVLLASRASASGIGRTPPVPPIGYRPGSAVPRLAADLENLRLQDQAHAAAGGPQMLLPPPRTGSVWAPVSTAHAAGQPLDAGAAWPASALPPPPRRDASVSGSLSRQARSSSRGLSPAPNAHHLAPGSTGSRSTSPAPPTSVSPRLQMPSLSPGPPPDLSLLIEDRVAWLRALRLHKYAPLFEHLTWEQLLELDEPQLEALGISAQGARAKFVKVFSQVKADAKKEGADAEGGENNGEAVANAV